MPIELAKISAFQLETLPRDKTVFFYPVGPLEDHGPHLPMGLDLQEASRLCYLAAQHLEQEMPGWVGIVMPAAPLGIDSNTTRAAITVRPHVLRDWLVDSCRSLMRLGFIHSVCFSGHLGPKQLTAIEDAGKIVRKTGRWMRYLTLFRSLHDPGGASLVSACSARVTWKHMVVSPFWPDPEEHGGKRDTSVALAISENQVDSHFLTLPKTEKENARWQRNWKRRNRTLSGYWGDPASADASLGEKDLLECLEDIFPKLRAVWEGSNPNALFRSWYSILPPNKSFFKAWLLAFGIILAIALWAIVMASSIEL